MQKGKVGYDPKTRRYYVSWYDQFTKKSYKVWFDAVGKKMYHDYNADQLLHEMRSDYRKKGASFRIQKWTQQKSDIGEYLNKWLKILKPNISESTFEGRKGHIKNHIIPFFEGRNLDLSEINYSLLVQFANQVAVNGQSKVTVLATLKAGMRQAKRDGIIDVIPEFPERRKLNIIKKVPKWLPEDRQLAVLHAMPKHHQPIFAWCIYHLKRPSEGRALYKSDLIDGIFMVQRGISAGKLVDYTKTRKVYPTPLVNAFKPYMGQMVKSFSPFYFINPESRTKTRHYGKTAMRNILIKALKKCNEPPISVYKFVKHSRITQLSHAGVSDADIATAADIGVNTVRHYRVAAVLEKKSEVLNRVVGMGGKELNRTTKQN